MSEGTSNPVYKLMTDSLKLVLINMLIRSIFELLRFHKVL